MVATGAGVVVWGSGGASVGGATGGVVVAGSGSGSGSGAAVVTTGAGVVVATTGGPPVGHGVEQSAKSAADGAPVKPALVEQTIWGADVMPCCNGKVQQAPGMPCAAQVLSTPGV